MGKLSSYTLVSTYGTGDLVPIFNSGVSNTRIAPSSLFNQYLGFGTSGYAFFSNGSSGVWSGIFPNQSGNSGKILATNGTGVLWINDATGSGGGGGTPGGSDTYVQYNSGGVFGGNSNFVYSGSSVGIGTIAPSSTLHIVPSSTTTVPLIVQRLSGHLENLTQWRSSSGNILSYVNTSGYLTLPHAPGGGFSGGLMFGSGTNWSSINGSIDTFDAGLHFNLGGINFFNMYKYGGRRIWTFNSSTELQVAGTLAECIAIAGQDKPTTGGYGASNCHQIGAHSFFTTPNSILDIGGALTLTQVTTTSPANRPVAVFEPFWNNSSDSVRLGAATIGVYSAISGLQVAARFNAISGGTTSTTLYTNVIVSGSGSAAANLMVSGNTTVSGNIISTSSGSFNLGSTSNSFGSGFLKTLHADSIVINSGISGAAYTWPIVYGWSFPSGVASGTGTNMSYEIPVILPCVLLSGAYCKIRSKTTGSGHPSGFMVDINVDGVSIWSANQANRLAMANNTRSGQQTSFDNSGVIGTGSYFSIDFDFVPTGTYANDIVVEILTMAQK